MLVMMQVEAAGFSCHVPAMREGTQSQGSALPKGHEGIHQKKQVGYSYMKQSRLYQLYGYGGGMNMEDLLDHNILRVPSEQHNYRYCLVCSTICVLLILHASA